jgi:hypothetical protein
VVQSSSAAANLRRWVAAPRRATAAAVPAARLRGAAAPRRGGRTSTPARHPG